MKRRKKQVILTLAVAATMALTACGGSDGGTSSSLANDSETTNGAAITIAKPDGPISVQSNNPWIADSSGMRLGYINAIYEPLAMVNLIDPSAEVTPWLAEEIVWNDDYTSVVLKAREGVKWNDGVDFTGEDIEFTMNFLKSNPELDTGSLGIDTVVREGNNVTVTFQESLYTKQEKLLHKFIIAKHIWENIEDPSTFENLDPVGTGPYILSNFTSESVELTARDDYWGGELAVPVLYYVSYNDNTALTTALGTGEADWAQAFIPNVQSVYLDKDPEHNVYWAANGLGIDAVFVNTTKAPFDDVAFRKAVNMVIDRDKHAEIAREGGVSALTSVTGLPSPAGDSYVTETFLGEEYAVDIEGAKEILKEAGYTWENEVLINPKGEVVTFELSVPQGWSDYVTAISLIADSVSQLGVNATLKTPDSDTWWANKESGDFQAIIHWTDTGITPYDLYSDIAGGSWLTSIGETASYNFGRYDNKEMTQALEQYRSAADDDSRESALATIQEIFVEDTPGMPLGNRPFTGSYNTRNYVGWPSEDDPYAPADPVLPTATLILTSLEKAS